MDDVSDLKINERSDVEWPNLRVTKIENKKWDNWFISMCKYENWQNCEECGISNGQTISKFANFLVLDSIPNWKNSNNLLIFQAVKLWKLVNFSI